MVKMFIRGTKHIMTVGPQLLQSGWYGGIWVKIVGSRTVEKATPTVFAGFLLLGYKLRDLDAAPYNYDYNITDYIPAQHENQPLDAYGRTLMMADSGEYDFNLNAYDTTQVYNYNDHLYLNNNAVLTNLNSGTPPVGIVISKPSDRNGWLGTILNINYA